MQTIVVNFQKGGSGKTMLCAHLAVQAERAEGGPVFLIDTDPQGTLSTWHEHRAAETQQQAEVPLAHIRQGLEALAQRGARYA
jgi:chromosome partitioning protein